MKKMLFMTLAVIAIAANAANIYTKVTSTPTDWAGTYLIVCERQNVVFNGGASEDNIDAKKGPAILATGFTFSNDTLIGSLTVDTATFTIGATDSETWPWYIQSASGLYLGHKDTADNGLSTELELKSKCKQQLRIDETGNFIAVACYEVNGPFNLQYNSDTKQLRFRYYPANDKLPIQIYKLVTSSTGLTPMVSSPVRATKLIRNGQLIIVKDGQEFSVLGK